MNDHRSTSTAGGSTDPDHEALFHRLAERSEQIWRGERTLWAPVIAAAEVEGDLPESVEDELHAYFSTMVVGHEVELEPEYVTRVGVVAEETRRLLEADAPSGRPFANLLLGKRLAAKTVRRTAARIARTEEKLLGQLESGSLDPLALPADVLARIGRAFGIDLPKLRESIAAQLRLPADALAAGAYARGRKLKGTSGDDLETDHARLEVQEGIYDGIQQEYPELEPDKEQALLKKLRDVEEEWSR